MQMSLMQESLFKQAAPVTEIQVGIAELKVAGQPNRLITFSLGSCVGVTLYDPFTRVGGLLHIMLPDSTQFNCVTKPAKYADLGIPLLLSEVRRKGGRSANLQAKLAGGAQMFSGMHDKFELNIGKRNAIMAIQTLKKLGIKIVAKDLGGNRGRTMSLDTISGQVFIRTMGNQLKVI